MRVKVDDTGNAIVDHVGNDFIITIPSRKSFFLLAFMIVWLGGWIIGEFLALSTVLSGDTEPFLVFWLIGWSIGGGFVLFTVLWILFGKEVIYSDRSFLVIEKRILFLKITKEYEIDSIKNLRVIEDSKSIFNRRRGLEYYGVTGGLIHFDYGMKTVQFGINIDVAEANHLVRNILTKLPVEDKLYV